MTMTSDFSHLSSDLANPVVGWLTPGLKNIGLTVIDDDGNSTSATIQVNVINQRPVAVFSDPSMVLWTQHILSRVTRLIPMGIRLSSPLFGQSQIYPEQ